MALSGTVSASSVGNVTAASIATALRLPVESVSLLGGTPSHSPSPSPSPSPAGSNDTGALRQLTALEAWVPAAPVSVMASVPEDQAASVMDVSGRRQVAAVGDLIIVSFLVLPATDRSGLSTEAVLASLLSMTDGSQSVWRDTPDVARVPGWETCVHDLTRH
jgi:hypothetical protein